MKTLALFIGLILLVFLLLRPKVQSPAKSSETVSVVQNQQATIVDAKTGDYIEKMNQQTLLKRNRYMAERELGIVAQSFPLNSDQTITLGVSFAPVSKWCENGDYDYMKAHMLHNPDKRMILSVEDINGNGAILGQTSITLEQMRSAKPITFKVKTKESNHLVGFYVCSGRSGRIQECANKRNISFTKLANAAVKQSLVFYFQPLYLERDKVKILPTLGHLSEPTAYKKLEKLMQPEQIHALGGVRTRTRQLGSIPMKAKHQEFVITLPYNDPRCPAPG